MKLGLYHCHSYNKVVIQREEEMGYSGGGQNSREGR